MIVNIKVYDKCKYDCRSKVVYEREYRNVVRYTGKVIPKDKIYSMGFDETDENDDYIILKFDDGETSTFRNSYCEFEVRGD